MVIVTGKKKEIFLKTQIFLCLQVICILPAWLLAKMVLNLGFFLKNFFSLIFHLEDILKNFVDVCKGNSFCFVLKGTLQGQKVKVAFSGVLAFYSSSHFQSQKRLQRQCCSFVSLFICPSHYFQSIINQEFLKHYESSIFKALKIKYFSRVKK